MLCSGLVHRNGIGLFDRAADSNDPGFNQLGPGVLLPDFEKLGALARDFAHYFGEDAQQQLRVLVWKRQPRLTEKNQAGFGPVASQVLIRIVLRLAACTA